MSSNSSKAGDTATYQVIAVKDGKFHQPRETLADALDHTGGRHQFLCRRCFKSDLQAITPDRK